MNQSGVAIAVLAKEPQTGRSKTRLSPPFTLEESAMLAAAMLEDVLQAVAYTPWVRRAVVLDGSPGPWLPPGFEVISQRGQSHAERIGSAFVDVGGPTLLIGMDTPQVTSDILAGAVQALVAPGIDAVLGPATDGGWWAAGLKNPNLTAFLDVPMSRTDTVVFQRRRFEALGLKWTELQELTDVDDARTAAAVARQIPDSRFARLLAKLGSRNLSLIE